MTHSKKKNIFRIILLAVTAVSLFFVPWLLVKAWILPLPDSLQEQATEAVDHGFDGVIVYVDQVGNAPQYATAGYHNRDEKTPARYDAYFKIASIGKLYDAVALTKMVAAGKLSLDKTLADYLPELQGRIENADQITLQHLVQHRSGIPNYTDTPDYWADPMKSFDENLGLILDKPANFKPDTDYEYCNTNYLLMNRIMNDALGYSNADFIRAEVFEPLGLYHTYRSLGEVDSADVMSGYHVGYPYDLKADDLGMVATAADVAKFVRALNDGSVFQGEEQELYNSLYELEHAGWVPGYQSFTKYHPELDAVTVEFYSTTDKDLLYWNLSEIINGRVVKILEESTRD